MKKQFVAAILVLLSNGATAKVTYDEAIKSDQQLNAANHHTPRTHGFTGTELSLQTSGGSGISKSFSTSANSRTNTIQMESASNFYCALAGVEGGFGGLDEKVKVYESGGVWYLSVSAGNTTIVGRAVCFSK